ncbi:MAG: S8 family serine peptidase [Thermoproteota archaeon]
MNPARNGKVNPWAEEAIKRAEARRKEVQGIPAVVEVEPGKAEEVASQLRRLGYSVEGVVSDFVFVDLPEPADFDKVSRLPNVRMVSVQKKIYPMALGVDELFKRVAIATDPLLSKLDASDLYVLGVRVKPAAEIPTPFGALATLATEAFKFAKDPLGRLMEYVRGFPPVIARADWKLVTDTRKLMEAPDDNRLNTTYVGNIDTGIYLNPAIGLPFINWVCDSITAEPPVDTMGHGSWTHSCAFGQPCLSRYGTFIPVALAPSSYHVKVFTAFGPCSSFQIMKAMEMCAVKGCKVVNMSLGGPLEGSVEEDPECVLAEKLYRQYGTNFIVAAGNDGEGWSINSPGASPYVLCVAAIDWKTMDTSSYSSRGPQARWYMENKDAYDRDYAKYGENFLKPDVAGIGGDRESQIVAAVSLWYDAFYDLVPDGFDLMIGTSMATPHCSGLVALAIDKGIIRNIDDAKDRMARFGEKTADKGYGLLTWSKLQ